MRRPPQTGFILAAVACAAATFFFATALVRALSYEPVPTAQLPAVPVTSASELGTPEAAAKPAEKPLTNDALALAADHDPFQQTRERPSEPYRMPDEFVEPAAPPPEPPAPPPFRVLGTAVQGNSGIVLMQVGEATPRVMTQGESLNGYTLERVENNSATMVGQGRSLRLAVSPPSPQSTRGNARRGGGGARGGGARGNSEAAARVFEELEARGLRVSPEMVDRLMRGGGAGEVRTFITENGATGVTIMRGAVRRDTMEMR
jgi:hypothetical protein